MAFAAPDSQSYPPLRKVRVEMDVELDDWAIRVADRDDEPEVGLLLEGRPFARHFVEIACDGREVHLWPHYRISTWDSFHVDGLAKVTATGFGGLFPFTLGEQPKLLRGVLEVLDEAARRLARKDAAAGATLRMIIGRIHAYRNARPKLGN